MKSCYNNFQKGGDAETHFLSEFLQNEVRTQKSQSFVYCGEPHSLWWGISSPSVLQKNSFTASFAIYPISTKKQSLFYSRNDFVFDLSNDSWIGKDRNELSSWTQWSISISHWSSFLSKSNCSETFLEKNALQRTCKTYRVAQQNQNKNCKEIVYNDFGFGFYSIDCLWETGASKSWLQSIQTRKTILSSFALFRSKDSNFLAWNFASCRYNKFDRERYISARMFEQKTKPCEKNICKRGCWILFQRDHQNSPEKQSIFRDCSEAHKT